VILTTLSVWKCQDLSLNLKKEDVLIMSNMELNDYYGSPEYHVDLAKGVSPSNKSASTLVQAGKITASELWCGIKRYKTHSAELKLKYNNHLCIIISLLLMAIMCQ
jgi:hypothetical protein